MFKEDVFPFKQITNRQPPLFPTEPVPTLDDFLVDDEDKELPGSIDDAQPDEGHADQTGVTDVNEPLPTNNEETTIRRSTRVSHPPIWMKDYVTQALNTTCHSQNNYFSYDNVSFKYKTYLSMFSADVEPKTFEQAVKDKRWIHVMQ